MKIYKIILYALFSLVVVLLVVAALLPDNITITTTTNINSNPEYIYSQVVSLKKWKNWSPFEHDSTMVDSFFGPDSGVGAGRSWEGKVIGKGKMTIDEARPYSYIKNRLDYGTRGKATGTWTFTPIETTKTAVRWSTQIGGLKFPFERWMGLLVKPMMQPMFKEGLESLKYYIETSKSVSVYPDSLNQNSKP